MAELPSGNAITNAENDRKAQLIKKPITRLEAIEELPATTSTSRLTSRRVGLAGSVMPVVGRTRRRPEPRPRTCVTAPQ